MATNISEGWVTKRSRWLHIWRRRYARQNGNSLSFYKNETAKTPHVTVDLSKCEICAKRIHDSDLDTTALKLVLILGTKSGAGYNIKLFSDDEADTLRWFDTAKIFCSKMGNAYKRAP